MRAAAENAGDRRHPEHFDPEGEGMRFRLLRLLTEEPELSQRELAVRLGMSLGKTNYSMRALIDRGWIKMRNFRKSGNKLAYAYVLTPRGLHAKGAAAREFLLRKQREYADLEREISELRAEIARGGESDSSGLPG